MKTIQDLKNMIAEPVSLDWFVKHGVPNFVKENLKKVCEAYLVKRYVSWEDVQANDEGGFSYPDYDQDGEYLGEIDLPEKFNSLFQ